MKQKSKSNASNFLKSWTDKANNFSKEDFSKLVSESKSLEKEIIYFKNYFKNNSNDGWSEIIAEFHKTFPGKELSRSFKSKRSFLSNQKKLLQLSYLNDLFFRADSTILLSSILASGREKELEKIKIEVFKSISNLDQFFDIDNIEDFIKIPKIFKTDSLNQFKKLSFMKQQKYLILMKEGLQKSSVFILLEKLLKLFYSDKQSMLIAIVLNKENGKLVLEGIDSYEGISYPRSEIGFVSLYCSDLIISNPKLFEQLIKNPEILNYDLLTGLVKEEIFNWIRELSEKSLSEKLSLEDFLYEGFQTEMVSDEALKSCLMSGSIHHLKALNQQSSASEMDRIFRLIAEIVKE